MRLKYQYCLKKLPFIIFFKKGKPLIKSVRQIDEDSVELEWSVGNLQFNFNDANLKRYRIFYRVDEEDFDFNLFEWPGEL